MPKLLDKKTSIDLAKVLVFILVTTLSTGLLVVAIGNISFKHTTSYKAVFSDVTGLSKNDDVRVAGVRVGSVKDIEVTHRTQALVTFAVDDDAMITGATNAIIKYRNLVGQRYIDLSQGVGSSTRLESDATIPASKTQSALDLTVLFDGFKPLFQALTPADVNKLSYEIIQVFQGEGSTLEDLLGHTADVTNTLASRNQIISSLIDNLNEVLDHLGDRDQQLNQLITTFKTFVGGLKDDRQAILGSLDQVSNLATTTAGLVKGIRQPLVDDISQLRSFTGNVQGNKSELDRALQVLPIKLNKVGRTATYGSWFNFYLCQFSGKIILPGVTVPISYNTGSARCDLG